MNGPIQVVTRPRWPDVELDVAALRADGWRPTPFRDFVLKVHQRCNLACDYCYVYTMADQSWRDRPMAMVPGTWRAAAGRIADHARDHELPRVRVILHGGEPLLLGVAGLEPLLADLTAAIAPVTALELQLQTNALLLDEPILHLLKYHGVRVGVSLDGTAEANDRHRRYADGRGSSAGVDRALRLLTAPEHRAAYAGLLATVDITQDPVECYDHLRGYAPPVLDFLLPHANWAHPPESRAGAPYGEWLIKVFDLWYAERPQPIRIRLFEDVIRLILGRGGRSEQVGLSPVAVAVVESDGAIEQVDSLKSAYPGACATGLTVFDDPFDAAFGNPGVVARQIGLRALCSTCRSCPLHTVCGAGHYAHRYRAGAGFLNPTVYCADMIKLIRHVITVVSDDVHQRLAVAHRD
ncbi:MULTISPECIES: FxsB family cyclophane-forming radical SAM/SPASM peptide maturase [Catenuloplanes]|uniref:Radical SAM core domain-containing protein n=1 Tax=Catenuloplanes niger TaxID=587534 RepID=A0AAE3ZTA0_9ACTN|nr:FxsB family cyclophane-forming radical SAM/SPASM peptide maturase [Catenuloplanes niger]MDR7324714.1 uncharacterized protein [Catenuloplanes niger]